jgi:hypothetical protein
VLRGATLLLLLAFTACGSSGSKQPTAGLPVVVLQSPSAASWVRLLRSAGYAAHDGDLASVLSRASAVGWSDPPTGPGLASFTGELGTARVAARTLELIYVTRPEALAVVTRRPRSLRLDGKPAPLLAQADPDGGTVVRLPRGRHVALLRF